MNQPQTDTLFFYGLSNWSDIGTVISEFNSIKIQVQAIEMLSPSEGFIKYDSPQKCSEAFQRFNSSSVSARFDFAEPNSIVDYPIAKEMATGQFICCKASLDLSCVPVEHLISTE
ncbi:hypothetical protein ENUP19_0161G0003 [Entamoeba nuttalli]|uniref:RRM domain-containing protein n=2 Tax=Entamoeba nuttalli TaxID=412467 RepID=K2G9T4_ENTNP|nr:hypothetical protein ENU1_139020 [Entamoeba nuttalli P19]EKE39171.1 hypothetical protein ENU1_139020 [Entamoeba nuttalli P19]|eukprot:XP_008858498.1 hypothetical protein ENU1_139020 [Entamoeba nuttalli P19]